MQAGLPQDDEERPARPSPEPAWEVARRTLAAAEQYVAAGSHVPPMHTLSRFTRAIVTPFVKLFLRLAQLITREQQSFNVETVRTLRALTEATRTDLHAVEHRLATIEDRLGAVEDRIAAAKQAQDRSLADLAQELAGVRRAVDEATASATERAASFEQALWAWRQESVATAREEARRAADDRARLKTQLLAHERRIGALDDAIGCAASGPAGDADPGAGLPARLDTFYLAFEDRFRGPRDEIRSRVSVYLPDVRAAGAGTPERPIVDLGCGRAEWLELLAAEGMTARGVDSNVATVAEARDRGLEAVEADALAHLRALPDQSCGAVTGFHLVEHLPFATVVALVDEIVRVLRPGGIAILETPNPTNLLVGAATFYIDPTHGRPLHPETLRFLVTDRGLERAEVRFLHPLEDARLPDEGNPIAARLNELLYGPQDYAVLAYRP
jgi:SAM-dependent methyltransferase